ncbi:SDR family oxidoreductase [Pseudonocardia sp. GCM10023141]|uniref:SDR family oxidoreductase n=1 Tax=Pseudonocardia sp. GCM10023141 TaxID=3252653 RepID=UPI00361A4744
MDLHGQRVVVLGGTSGIGLATASAAAGAGAAVVVGSSRRSSVDKALAELPAGAEGRVVDLTDPAGLRDLFAGLGPIDHLVHTAGESLALTPLDTLDMAVARGFFTVRYFGALAAAQAAAPTLRPGGSITLTTGAAKDRPLAGWSVAASVCGAVEALTKALAVELAPLRVNAVSPGVIRSPLWDGMAEADRTQMYAAVAATLPVGRVGEVRDVAQAYLYLMTQPHSSGVVLTLDGGGVLV